MKKYFIICLSAFMLIFAGCGQQSQAGFSKTDLLLNISGTPYHVGVNIQTALDTMGDGYEYAEGKTCAYDSVDKTYTYDNATFYTNPLSQGDIISEIYTESQAVSTSRGIAIGSSKEEVVAAYGAATQDDGNLLIYRLPDTQGALCFEMENDAVIAIFITTEAI